MKPVIIIAIAFVLLIPISVYAQVNPYEIIEVSLNKAFVEKNEVISVEGKVKRINPDFNKVIFILETKEGHRTDYVTSVLNDDGSFEHHWQAGSIYTGTWGESGVFVIKMNYASKDIWKEIEFVYCDKTWPHHPRYLEHCQEAFGYVDVETTTELKSFESLNSETTSKLQTKVIDGMVMEYRGLDPTGSPLWVETDENYFGRIMVPLIFNIIVICVIIGIIVLVIYKVITRSKSKQIEIKSFSKGQLSYLRNVSAEETIKFFIQHEHGDQKRLNDILKSIEVNEILSDSDKKYILYLLEKTKNWENR